jgi:TatD DNase family protein
VVALGECGLDYARLEFCPKEVQLEFFERQLEMAAVTKLPMFLHLRDAGDDFITLMRKHRSQITGGVVHSFDGSAELATEILALDLSIGINGCSLRESVNLEVSS